MWPLAEKAELVITFLDYFLRYDTTARRLNYDSFFEIGPFKADLTIFLVVINFTFNCVYQFDSAAYFRSRNEDVSFLQCSGKQKLESSDVPSLLVDLFGVVVLAKILAKFFCQPDPPDLQSL